MKYQDFSNLKIGDIVEVMTKYKNYGKRGIVRQIDKERIIGDPTWKGSVLVSPIDCEFVFAKHMCKRRFKDGLVRLFKNEIKVLNKEAQIVDDKMTELLLIYPEEIDGGSRWSIWTIGLTDGLISLDLYERAKEYYGDLWYSTIETSHKKHTL